MKNEYQVKIISLREYSNIYTKTKTKTILSTKFELREI